jgi:hypothetical protein
MTAINMGIAMIERTTKICERTKPALISLIAASPSESARSVARMTPTASVTLSPPDESNARRRFCI